MFSPIFAHTFMIQSVITKFSRKAGAVFRRFVASGILLMNVKRLTQIISMAIVVILSSSACAVAKSVISTPIPPTPTSSPPTQIPERGIGIPVSGEGWQVSLDGVRTADSLKMGLYPNETTTTPKDGYAFLIVDLAIRSLDPTRSMSISLDNVAILDANNKIHTADGGGWAESSMCAGCVISISRSIGARSTSITAFVISNNNISFQAGSVSSEDPISFVFVIKSDELNQEWRLQFQDIPPMPFKLGDKAVYPLVTEVVAQASRLPDECYFDSIQTAQTKTGVVLQEWTDNKLVTNFVVPDGSTSEELCKGHAYETLQVAPDGGILLKAGPLQGWANLYFIEPDGRVLNLVRNALAVSGDFMPGNKYAVVSVTQVGKKGEQLYLYDREKGLMTLLYEGSYINYRIFPNGNLLVNGMSLETSERFVYMGPVGADALPVLELPEGAASSDITLDGTHLLYSDYIDGTTYLYLSNIDGSNKTEIMKGDIPYDDKFLSTDGKYLLIRSNETTQASLYDITAKSSRLITPDSSSLEYAFSPDGKWIIAISTFKRDDNDKANTKKQTLYLFSMDSQKVMKEIQGEIVNYFFSPDNAYLAYTIKNEDETLGISVVNLADLTEQSLGQGFLSGWSVNK